MLEEKFLKNIDSTKLFTHNSKILLTISGGLDSMVLLHLLKNELMDIGIAHCNFQLRAEESDGDTIFVRTVAQQYDIPYFEKSFNTKKYATDNRLSIQEAARDLRYNWFEQLVVTEGYELYATAHHFDDQMETFFINLFRGTGVKGLRGIRAKNGKCIRPLLFATRDEIEKYAAINGITHREDSSNQSNNYLRNRIRHQLLPVLQNIKSDYKQGFEKTLHLLAETDKMINQQVEVLRKKLFLEDKNQIRISIEELQNLQNIKFYLHELLKPFGFNEDAVSKIPMALNGTPGKIFNSKTHQLLIDRKDLIITPLNKRQRNTYYIGAEQNEISDPLKLTFERIPYHKNTIIDPNHNVAQLDINKIEFPLEIRRWKEGDYFYPFGVRGRKKVSDYFIDKKMSLVEKQETWLLTSKDKIVWIVGHRIDDRFKLDHHTKHLLKVSLLPS